MQQMPERPDVAQPKSNRNRWLAYLIGGIFAIGLIGVLTEQPEQPEPAVETVTVTPDAPTPTEEPDPVETAPTEDPMDAAIADLKSEIFIIKHCNTQHDIIASLGEETAKQIFIEVVNDGDTSRGDGTIGGSWLDVSARHQIGVSALYDEVMFRFC